VTRYPITVAALALVAGACTSESATPEPYRGEPPFPNLRTEFASEGRTLGYVANRMSDSVSVIDLDGMSLLGSAPLGRDPVDVDGPRHVVIDPKRGIGYVTLSYPLSIVSAHASRNDASGRNGFVQAFSLSDLGPIGELRVDPGAADLAISDDGSTLLVSHFDLARSVLMPDLESRRATLALIDSAPAMAADDATLRSVTVCVSPSSIVYESERARAFVVCTGEDTLAVVDTDKAEVLSYVPAGERDTNKPYALVRSPFGERLALSNQIARSVVLFDVEDAPSSLGSLYLTEGIPYFVGWLSSERFVVPMQSPSGAALVDARDMAILNQVGFTPEVCENPSEARGFGEGRLMLVCEGSHFAPGAVVELDPETLDVLARVEVGIYPDRLAVLEP
jgi:hypothetical protein